MTVEQAKKLKPGTELIFVKGPQNGALVEINERVKFLRFGYSGIEYTCKYFKFRTNIHFINDPGCFRLASEYDFNQDFKKMLGGTK